MKVSQRVLTIKDLATYLSVHQSTVYRLLRRGELPGFKIGSDWRFNIEAIDRWREDRTLQMGQELEARKIRAA